MLNTYQISDMFSYYSDCVNNCFNPSLMLSQGVYICAFSSGSVSHKASSQLRVALLPDDITMTLDPQTVDCSERKEEDTVTVTVNATIKTSTENYVVEWKHQGTGDRLPVTQGAYSLQSSVFLLLTLIDVKLNREMSVKCLRSFQTFRAFRPSTA